MPSLYVLALKSETNSHTLTRLKTPTEGRNCVFKRVIKGDVIERGVVVTQVT